MIPVEASRWFHFRFLLPQLGLPDCHLVEAPASPPLIMLDLRLASGKAHKKQLHRLPTRGCPSRALRRISRLCKPLLKMAWRRVPRIQKLFNAAFLVWGVG